MSYTDPFGLYDVTGGEAEMKAYNEAKQRMATCAGGIASAVTGVGVGPCNASQAANAIAGLAKLHQAEADHSVTINIQFTGLTKNGYNTPSSGGRQIYVNPASPDMGRKYDVGATIVHEVHESYDLFKGGNLPTAGNPAYPGAHRSAVIQAEDPALIGGGMQSRTSRTPYCQYYNIDPAPFGTRPAC